jgi:serine protease DegQ
MRGSPADKAGIKPGDVLAQVTGKKVKDAQVDAGTDRRAATGQDRAFHLKREGRDVAIDITIGKRPRRRRNSRPPSRSGRQTPASAARR